MTDTFRNEPARQSIAAWLAQQMLLQATPASPYQIDEVTSDPAAPIDLSVTQAYNSLGLPTTQLNPGDLVNPDRSFNTMEAPDPAQQLQETAPPENMDLANLEAPSPQQQARDALDTMDDQTAALAAQAARNNSFNDMVQEALDDAITANITGPDAETGGFGTGMGFSSAQAANDAVAGALADAGNAAGVVGLGLGGLTGGESSGSTTDGGPGGGITGGDVSGGYSGGVDAGGGISW